MGLLQAIDDIYTEIPFYGYRKVHQQLIERGFSVGVNHVRFCMRELGLKTIYPTKAVKTTRGKLEHRKYPYFPRILLLTEQIRFGVQVSPTFAFMVHLCI